MPERITFGEIKEIETKYIGQDDGQVAVSLLLPSRDWNLLKNSFEWKLIEQRLEEIRNKDIQG